MKKMPCESELQEEKPQTFPSLEAPDDEGELVLAQKGRKRMDSRPTCHYLAEDYEEEQVSGELNHLVQRNAGEAQWTVKKVTVAVDTEPAEDVTPRRTFWKYPPKRIREIQEWEEVQRTRRRAHQELWTASHVRQNS